MTPNGPFARVLVIGTAIIASVASVPPSDGSGEDTGDGVPYPVEILSVSLQLLSTGDPDVYVTFKNVSEDMIIDEAAFHCEFYRENNPVEQWGYDDTEINLVDGGDLPPGQQVTSHWENFGWDGTNKVVVTHERALVEGEGTLRCDADDDCPTFVACLAGETSCPEP